ncbi:MAG TPA: 4Fe-4S binding protein [Candidatus Hydrogenedentes bacterium]|nr:4Fe-4S binding protein [Candidatus Hydrogenedentota bacterium]
MGAVDFSKVRLEQRTLAGVKIPVAVVPRIKKQSYLEKILIALKGLMKGMRLTFGYLIHPSRIVTQQYPENRATLKFPERYRANLKLIYDENGYHLCGGCKMCEKACPNASIKVLNRKGPVTGKLELDRYIWRMDSCTFCNLCVMACPSDALQMTHQFENAVYDRRLLIYNLNRYAGPPAEAMAKLDEEARKQAMEPRDVYGGPVPLNGEPLPNIPPIVIAGEEKAASETPPSTEGPAA